MKWCLTAPPAVLFHSSWYDEMGPRRGSELHPAQLEKSHRKMKASSYLVQGPLERLPHWGPWHLWWSWASSGRERVRAEWGCSEKKDLKILHCRLPSSPAQLPKPQHQSHPCLQSPRLSPQQGWAWGKSIEASVWLSSRQRRSWSMAVNLRLTNNCSSYNFQLFFCRIVQIFLKVIKTIIILWKHFTR